MRAEARRSRSGSLSWPRGFAARSDDRAAALVLSALRGITAGRLLELAQTERTAGGLLERIRAGDAGSENDRRTARTTSADELGASLRRIGARFVLPGDAEYPARVEHLADPPLALFVRGRALAPGATAVAIVGARNCSDLGRDVARELGRALAAGGVTVVSGAARGIDSASHRGALDAGGETVAVLGGGIDAGHAKRSGELLRRIVAHGSLVSEYPPGVPADAFRFPARNRIVAALSRAVVVVEGAERSGSLISAEHALELGRDVFAVPGAVTNPLAAAPHRLIREGATLIRGAGDLLDALGIGDRARASPDELRLPAEEGRALDAVRDSVVPDRVAAELAVPVPDALALLLRLEMRGLVRSVGGRFERTLAASPPSDRARGGQAGLGRSGPPRRSGGPPPEA